MELQVGELEQLLCTVRHRQRMKGDNYEHAGNTISALLSNIFHLNTQNIFEGIEPNWFLISDALKISNWILFEVVK